MQQPKIPGVKPFLLFCQLSSQTLIYKGQLRTDQVLPFFIKIYKTQKIESFCIIPLKILDEALSANWEIAQPFPVASLITVE